MADEVAPMNAEANVQKKTAGSSDNSVKDAIPQAKSRKTAKSTKIDSRKAVDSHSMSSRRVWPD